MKNEFERLYNNEMEAEAKVQNDELSWSDAYRDWYKEYNAKGTFFQLLYREYKEARENGNTEMNINRSLCQQADEVAKCLKENGVTRFTFSSNWNGAIKDIWELQKLGYKMMGMTEVNDEIDSFTKERKMMPAFIFELA